MPQEKRDSILIVAAKATIERFAPDYYPDKEPIRIESKVAGGINFSKEDHGRVYHIVTFPKNVKVNEQVGDCDYDIRVAVWGDTFFGFMIMFGDGTATAGLDKPRTRDSQKRILRGLPPHYKTIPEGINY